MQLSTPLTRDTQDILHDDDEALFLLLRVETGEALPLLILTTDELIKLVTVEVATNISLILVNFGLS
jgi:hypothetical protein